MVWDNNCGTDVKGEHLRASNENSWINDGHIIGNVTISDCHCQLSYDGW